jgi:hypothetical protein
MPTNFLNVKNRASSILSTNISATDTTLTITPGDEGKFPNENFHITIDDEILLCVSRSGNVFTVQRAKENTIAAPHTAGAKVELRITAKIISDLNNAIKNLEERNINAISPIGGGGNLESDFNLFLIGTEEDRILYTTGVNTWAETTLTPFARSLLDDIDAAMARDTLGIDSILNNLVPYAGATADLDLGVYGLYASQIHITGEGNIIFYSQDNTMGLGILTFDVSGNLNITNLQTTWSAILETSYLDDNRTFYFPNNSGTFALLENNQTFTGIATFNNNIQLGEVSLLLDDSISADGKWSGIAETGTLGEACSFGDLVYFKSADSKWYLANANSDTTSGNVKLGICLVAGSANSNTTILLYGKVRASTAFPTMTVGAPQYVSTTAGDIQGTPPSGTDNVIRIVGFANTSSELFFCPENSYLTHT